ncbi:hypothetical protein MMC25_005850 [Agyrium rufum]|nr:hypothetical protein [Agyrium rufum]
MQTSTLLGAASLLALFSYVSASVTTVYASITTVTEIQSVSVIINATASAASSTAAETTITTEFNAAQTTLLYSELYSYISGSEYGALVSELATELPESIATKENSIGFAGLSTEYGSSFTEQSWYSYVINVHTQVLSAENSIIDDVATKLVNATTTAITSTSFSMPTSAAATVTGPSKTSSISTSIVTKVASSTASAAAAVTTTSPSSAAAAAVTAGVQRVLGVGAAMAVGFAGVALL